MEATVNPMVMKWIDQMDDWDQSSAYYGYQCLEREVFHATAPGNEAGARALAKNLAAALVEKGDLDADRIRDLLGLEAPPPPPAPTSGRVPIVEDALRARLESMGLGFDYVSTAEELAALSRRLSSPSERSSILGSIS